MNSAPLKKTALLGLLAALAFPSLPAHAGAPVLDTVDLAFYTAPAALPATHGDLIRHRTASLNLGAGAPSVQAWNVMFRSTDAVGTESGHAQ